MPEIRRAYPADVDMALPLLRQFDTTADHDEKWRKLFRHYWECPEEHIGYIMIEDGRAIGFIGILFSRRTVAGREERVCGLSSWIVAERSRQHSLSMLLYFLKDLKEYTITNFTPIPDADMIFRKMKWEYFEDAVYWILPSPSSQPVEISEVSAANVHLLNTADRQIYEDHKQFVGDHLIATINGKHVYMLLRKTKMSLHRFITNKLITYPNFLMHKLTGKSLLQRNLDFERLIYCSDKSALPAISYAVANYFDKHKGRRLLIDKRFLTIPPAKVRKVDIIKLLYKSGSIAPTDIDALYTELFVLNLP